MWLATYVSFIKVVSDCIVGASVTKSAVLKRIMWPVLANLQYSVCQTRDTALLKRKSVYKSKHMDVNYADTQYSFQKRKNKSGKFGSSTDEIDFKVDRVCILSEVRCFGPELVICIWERPFPDFEDKKNHALFWDVLPIADWMICSMGYHWPGSLFLKEQAF